MGDLQFRSVASTPRLEWDSKATVNTADTEEDSTTGTDAPQFATPVTRGKNPDEKDKGNVAATAFGMVPVVLQLGNVAASFFTRGNSEATGPKLNLPLIPLRTLNLAGHYPKFTMNKTQANLIGGSEMGIAVLEDAYVAMDYFDPLTLDTPGGLGLAFTAGKDLFNTLELNKSTSANIANLNVFSSSPFFNGVFHAAGFMDGTFKFIHGSQVAAKQFTISDYGCTPYQSQNGCNDEEIRDNGNNTGSILGGFFDTEEPEQNENALPDVDGLAATVLAVNEATVGTANAGKILSAYEVSEALKTPDGNPGPQSIAALTPFVANLIIRGVQLNKNGETLGAPEVLTDLGLFGMGTAASLITRDPRVKIATLPNASYLAWGPAWPKVLGLVDSHSGFFGEGQYDNPNSIFNLTPALMGSVYALNSFYAGSEAGYALSLNPKRFENWIPTIMGGIGLAGQWISYGQTPNEKAASTLALGTATYAASTLASLGLARLVMDQTGYRDAKLAVLSIKPKNKKTEIEINPNLGISPEGVFLGVSGRW